MIEVFTVKRKNCRQNIVQKISKKLVENKESAIESLIGSQGFVNADSWDLFC